MLEHYSKSGGNRLESLRSYCDEAQYKDVYGFARRVDGVQGSLWGLVLGRMGQETVTETELQQITETFVLQNARWVNERGVAALMRWLVWMARHEGLVSGD